MATPKLRFKEFSGEWVHKPLSYFVTRVTRRNRGNESRLPLTISAQYGLVDQTEFFNKTVASRELENYYLLYNGDFAYNKSYSNGYPFGAVKRLDRYDKGVLSSLYICFVQNNIATSDYLTHYFETTKWHKEVSMIAVEGARNHGLLNIAVGDFFDTLHFAPETKTEQEKLANFLNLVNRKIALQRQKIKLLNDYTKGLISRLFQTEKGQWVKLKVLCKYSSSTNTFSLIENATDGDYPVYDAQGVVAQIGHFDMAEPYIAIIKDGAGVGRQQICSAKSSFIATMGAIQPIGVSLDYLYLVLQMIEFSKFVTGSTIPHIYFKDYGNVLVPLPNDEEQAIQSKAFSLLRKKVYKLEQVLDSLLMLKSGLLQQMFI